MFKVSYFMEVLPIIASKVNVTFELTIAATIFALLVGVIIAIIGYYKIPVLYQITRVYVSLMRGTPVVTQADMGRLDAARSTGNQQNQGRTKHFTLGLAYRFHVIGHFRVKT